MKTNKELLSTIKWEKYLNISHPYDWYKICRDEKLSEEFIRYFQDKVNWFGVSFYQKLSEQFIEEFADKVDWTWIFENQKLSNEFKEKWKHKFENIQK